MKLGQDQAAFRLPFGLRAAPHQPPTVLYVLGIEPSKLGGVELFCAELGRRLEALGWRLVLCFESSPCALVKKVLGRPNVAFEVLAAQERVDARRTWEFARLVRKYQPQVVVYGLNSVIRGYPWVAKLLSVDRIYYNDHTSRGGRWQAGPARRNQVKSLLARAVTYPVDKVLAVSEFVERSVRDSGLIAPERVTHIHNGVELPQLGSLPELGRKFRARYGFTPEQKLIAQVSWMVPTKGIDKLLYASQKVLSACPTAHLLLVGDGQNRAEYEQLARSLGIASRVTFTGNLQSPADEGVFAATDVSCQLSQWDEAFGLTIAEAMAHARPVVATAVGGIPEIVQHDRSGFLVERTDVQQMAECIGKLVTDDALRLAMGKQARRVVEERFALARTVDLYLQHLGIVPTTVPEVAVAERASLRPVETSSSAPKAYQPEV